MGWLLFLYLKDQIATDDVYLFVCMVNNIVRFKYDHKSIHYLLLVTCCPQLPEELHFWE